MTQIPYNFQKSKEKHKCWRNEIYKTKYIMENWKNSYKYLQFSNKTWNKEKKL